MQAETDARSVGDSHPSCSHLAWHRKPGTALQPRLLWINFADISSRPDMDTSWRDWFANISVVATTICGKSSVMPAYDAVLRELPVRTDIVYQEATQRFVYIRNFYDFVLHKNIFGL